MSYGDDRSLQAPVAIVQT